MTRKLWAVVRREYLERVRTKAFLIGTLLGPLLMAVMMVGPMFVAKRGGKPLRVAVVDAGGRLQAAAEQVLREARFEDKPRFEVLPAGTGTPEQRERELRSDALAGRLDGYVLLPRDAVEGARASYFGRSVSNRLDLRTMERTLGELLLTQRLILQPEIEANLYGRSDALRGVADGLSDATVGLRLRYEIRRQFAPYVGVVWTHRNGDGALHGSDTQFVAGLRVWF